MWKVWCRVCFLFVFVGCHPTMYKLNGNRVLEPDLVPVSSTVIPLPVYQVGYGLNLASATENEKTIKPKGPIQLVTVYTKKKPITAAKAKSSDISIVKHPQNKAENDS